MLCYGELFYIIRNYYIVVLVIDDVVFGHFWGKALRIVLGALVGVVMVILRHVDKSPGPEGLRYGLPLTRLARYKLFRLVGAFTLGVWMLARAGGLMKVGRALHHLGWIFGDDVLDILVVYDRMYPYAHGICKFPEGIAEFGRLILTLFETDHHAKEFAEVGCESSGINGNWRIEEQYCCGWP